MAERDELRAVAEARVGAMVGGKYRLDSVIGLGGMAAVYAATHRNGKRVALKLLHDKLAGSDRQRKRFVREAYVANAIGHPGVVQVHDDGVDPELGAYLIMELLDGESVGSLQRRHGGVIGTAAALRVADQLLDVLATAHARGVVHRDIKPDNLFVTRSGEIKVLDFGVARSVEHVAGATFDTAAGSMLGTPAFMPQEQARGRWDEVDARSDLWAVGATLFSLLSGEPVHIADTPNEQLGRAMSVPPRSLSRVRVDLPASLVAVVDCSLQFEPADRFADAHAMRNALREAMGGLPQAPDLELKSSFSSVDSTLPTADESDAVFTVAAPTPPARTRTLVLVVAIALAIVLVAVGWRTWNSGRGAPQPTAGALGDATSPTPVINGADVPRTSLPIRLAHDLLPAQPKSATVEAPAPPIEDPATPTPVAEPPARARQRPAGHLRKVDPRASVVPAVDPLDRRR